MGHEIPRIFTPPLRKLTPKTTLGFAVIEFAEEILGITLIPWQRWLLIHALELLPDGSMRFRTVIVLVARQNGKSMLSVILALFFMYVLGRELVIGTAQDLDVAEEIWQEAVDLAEDTDELSGEIDRVVKVNGKKALELRSGERYKVKAANRRAGRGLSGDLILLDELREHQSWDAWGAITKTTMARAAAMIWALSNAGDATSVVLRYLRKMAHLALGDPDNLGVPGDLADEAEGDELMEDLDDDSVAIFEWSAPPDCSTRDREAWSMANPSMGHTITERTIASACATDPEWIFRTEVLCQWSDGSLEGPFPPGVWEAGTDEDSRRAPDSEIAFCVDVSADRTQSHIGIAARRADGIAHVEVIASRAGTAWVVPWFTERVEKYGGMTVALQGRGAPVSSLAEELKEVEGLEVVEWQGSELGRGTGAFYDSVCLPLKDENGEPVDPTRGVRHLPQPLLDIAAATAVTKPMGDGAWVWDRMKSATDIAPLVAVTGALWLLNQKTEEPARSAYEDRGLAVV